MADTSQRGHLLGADLGTRPRHLRSLVPSEQGAGAPEVVDLGQPLTQLFQLRRHQTALEQRLMLVILGKTALAWSPDPHGLADRMELARNLRQAGVLQLPNIHEAFFEDLGPVELPDEICWAFLDGDLYQSILMSLELVYPRLPPGSAMVLDDYGWDTLPGVERACSDFLADKPESATVFGDAKVAVVVRQIEGRAGG